MSTPAKLYFYGVKLPMRHNVRECLRKPVLQLLRGDSGRLAEVELNEAQLLELVRHSLDVLQQMYRSHGAAQPDDCPPR